MIEAEVLETVGKIAGIGGLALGVMLLLFRDLIRKSIFPTLKKDDAYRVWSSQAHHGLGVVSRHRRDRRMLWAEVGTGTGGDISTGGACSPVIVGTDGNVTVSSDCPDGEGGASQ